MRATRVRGNCVARDMLGPMRIVLALALVAILAGCGKSDASPFGLAQHTANAGGGPGGRGYGNGVGGMDGKKDVDIGISNDTAIVMGSLDKELIRQVIHRNRQQIQYCYEMQLTKYPSLAGKVSIAFVIGADGTVAQSKVASSNLNNPELEQCVAARFKSWLFPKPKGGGIVNATYPIVFEKAQPQ